MAMMRKPLRVDPATKDVGMSTVLVLRGQPRTATAAGLQLCRHADMLGLLESELSRNLPGSSVQASLSTIRLAVNADSLATRFMPAFAAFAAKGTALLDIVLDDQDHTAGWLQDQWLSQYLGQCLQPPMDRPPSSQGFVQAALLGIGWGMNPVALVATHLSSGQLIELVPGQVVDTALYWQHTRRCMPQIDWLTQQVMAAAKGLLLQQH